MRLKAQRKVEVALLCIALLPSAAYADTILRCGEYEMSEGLARRAEGELGAAIALFEQGLAACSGALELQAELAMTLAWYGEHAKSLAHYDALLAQELEPFFRRGMRLNRARVLGWAGRIDEAEAAYAKLLEEKPGDPAARLGRAFVMRLRFREGEARRIYETLLNEDPENVEAREGLKAVEETTHWQLDALGGGSYFKGSGELRPTAELRLGGAWSPNWRLAARYAALVPGGVLGFSDDAPWLHDTSLEVARRLGQRFELSAGYGLRAGAGQVAHLLPLRVSAVLDPRRRWTLLGGARPGLRDDGAKELLADAGILAALNRDLWLLGQAFVFLDREQTNYVILGTVGATVWTHTQFRFSAGMGATRDIFSYPVNFAVEQRLSVHWALLASYEFLGGFVFRHAFSSGFIARW